jgi:sarcosine dehydrogenase
LDDKNAIINSIYFRTIYTCALNNRGGVEVDLTVTPIESGVGELHDPIFKGRGYYCVAGGASMYHTICHMREAIQEKNLRAVVTDVTNELGILSVQGQIIT